MGKDRSEDCSIGIQGLDKNELANDSKEGGTLKEGSETDDE